MTITVLHNQSLLDIAIQHTGSVENAFAIAVANGLSVSSMLTAGMTLDIPNDVQKDNDVLYYYTTKNLQPATAYNPYSWTVDPILEGIGYWYVNSTLIVS